MLSLQESGLGVDQGIPTLVIAAASVDDVLAISGFGVVLGIAFSSGKQSNLGWAVNNPFFAIESFPLQIRGSRPWRQENSCIKAIKIMHKGHNNLGFWVRGLFLHAFSIDLSCAAQAPTLHSISAFK